MVASMMAKTLEINFGRRAYDINLALLALDGTGFEGDEWEYEFLMAAGEVYREAAKTFQVHDYDSAVHIVKDFRRMATERRNYDPGNLELIATSEAWNQVLVEVAK